MLDAAEEMWEEPDVVSEEELEEDSSEARVCCVLLPPLRPASRGKVAEMCEGLACSVRLRFAARHLQAWRSSSLRLANAGQGLARTLSFSQGRVGKAKHI